MKLAVPYEAGEVAPNFGMVDEFMVYTVETGRIAASESMAVGDATLRELPDLLASWGVDELLCKGIPSNSQHVLETLGIKVTTGAGGDARGQVAVYLAGGVLGDPCAGCGYVDPETGACTSDNPEEAHAAGTAPAH